MEGMGYEKPEEIEIRRKSAGRFILATNLVDDNKLEPSEIIKNYKNQQSCEMGASQFLLFREIKIKNEMVEV
jgi:hypothetical protein